MAIEDYDNTVRLCPNYKTDFMDSDLAHGGEEAIEGAIELLNSVVSNPPGSVTDFYYAGVRALLYNERDLAREYFERAKQLGHDAHDKIEEHLRNLK